ncbi:hypothetical protein OE749_09625 [Aestuariibacter sp. AA17]|uniref:Uncharacterized protein n=1 Tax=Fluctibacter corallii TaxID=2984329 RepID=A0ABT3A8F2_9ALTE|nr:hypothetical protein [Aestuariibacter sp. AA17]MCV2884955.1 hypothetical protein [Aestuariibacter sp. AA17]
MLAFLILPILGTGFYILINDPQAFIRLHRYQGQLLYLKCLGYGLMCFLLAFILGASINYLLPPQLHLSAFSLTLPLDVHAGLVSGLQAMQLGNAAQLNQVAWFIILSLLMFFIASGWCWLSDLALKRRSEKNGIDAKIFLMKQLVKDSPMDKMLLDASLQIQPMLFSLSNRKVYVGFVSSMGEPTENEGMDQEVRIVPIMSGYRDTNTLVPVFEHEYHRLDKALRKSLSITIRQELIDTVCPFSFDVYKQVIQTKPAVDKKLTLVFQPSPPTYTWQVKAE